MSPVPKDFHGAARLVAAVGDLQPPLPATSLGVVAPIRQQLGTIDSRRRRYIAVARPIDRATLGRTLAARGNFAGSEVLAVGRLECRDVSHHPRLGLDRDPPYSAHRGKKSVSREVLDELKQQISLLDYLQAQDWRPARRLSRGRLLGLCPLHDDHQPSFLVDPGKSLFYCYGCGRGGDVIRFAELYHKVKFPKAVALLHQWRGLPPLLHEAAGFYRMQLHRHGEAVAYLYQRGVRSPELIEHMRIGYAPGGCLRAWLMQLGYPLHTLREAGLVTDSGYDAYMHRVVFPLDGNLYGRSLSAAAPPHRFLPGAKGGLYVWEQVRQYPEVILVEGLFDYAVLWQAGFHNVTCSMGNHLNEHQHRQLCDRPRTVYLAFDADTNGSGQHAAQSLACRLREHGMNVRRVSLPDGHDPNSFFVEDGDALQFQSLLEAALP
jgi:DNA primase